MELQTHVLFLIEVQTSLYPPSTTFTFNSAPPTTFTSAPTATPPPIATLTSGSGGALI